MAAMLLASDPYKRLASTSPKTCRHPRVAHRAVTGQGVFGGRPLVSHREPFSRCARHPVSILPTPRPRGRGRAVDPPSAESAVLPRPHASSFEGRTRTVRPPDRSLP